jgi:hypothetical protein
MTNRASLFLTLILMAVLACVMVQAQAAPNANQSQGHSGVDEGKNGPQSPTPPPPPGNAKNPETPGATGKVQTLTGVVSDSYCGRKHYQLTGATPAECTRYCIAHRGTFALVVGDKVYSLQDRPGHTLDALAGQSARVTGAVNGSVIEIESVSPVGKQGSGNGR